MPPTAQGQWNTACKVPCMLFSWLTRSTAGFPSRDRLQLIMAGQSACVYGRSPM